MYNLGINSASIRTLLPSRNACHLPPQRGLIKQGGLRNQAVLFYVRTKLSSREHLLFSENEIMSEGSPVSNRLQVKTFSRIVATEGFSLAKA